MPAAAPAGLDEDVLEFYAMMLSQLQEELAKVEQAIQESRKSRGAAPFDFSAKLPPVSEALVEELGLPAIVKEFLFRKAAESAAGSAPRDLPTERSQPAPRRVSPPPAPVEEPKHEEPAAVESAVATSEPRDLPKPTHEHHHVVEEPQHAAVEGEQPASSSDAVTAATISEQPAVESTPQPSPPVDAAPAEVAPAPVASAPEQQPPQEPTSASVVPPPAPAAAPASNYHARITAMYQKYQPEKISQVDNILLKYKGAEEDLMQALIHKYGPEPGTEEEQAHHQDAVEEEAAAVQHDPAYYRAQIEKIYTKFCPEKLNSIDALMKKYENSEAQLFEAVVTKYGPPPSEEEYVALRVALASTAAPTAVTAAPVAPAPTPAPPAADPLEQPRCGQVLNLGRKGFMQSFKSVYAVARPEGFFWFKDKAQYEQQVQAGAGSKPVSGPTMGGPTQGNKAPNGFQPIDWLPWFTLTTNSRGSRFKTPMGCLPKVTQEMHSKMKSADVKKIYWGLQFVDGDNSNEILVIGVDTPAERDAWIKYCTAFVPLSLPFGCEDMAGIPVGRPVPTHKKEVMGGEAPGSPNNTNRR